MSAGAVTSTMRSGLALKMNICMRAGAPSAGVDMLELSRPLKSWPSARRLSPPRPPRPKLSCCALPLASSKPDS